MGPIFHYRWCGQLYTKRLNVLDSIQCNFTSWLVRSLGLKWPFRVGPHRNSGAESWVWSTPSDCTEVSRERWTWLRSLSQHWVKITTRLYSRPALVLCLSLLAMVYFLVLVTSVAIWSLQNNPDAFLLGLQKQLHFHCSPGWSISCLGCNCLWCLHFTIYVYNWLLRAELLLSPKILSFSAYLAFPGNFRGDELSQRTTRPSGTSFSLISNNQILQKCDYVRFSFQG